MPLTFLKIGSSYSSLLFTLSFPGYKILHASHKTNQAFSDFNVSFMWWELSNSPVEGEIKDLLESKARRVYSIISFHLKGAALKQQGVIQRSEKEWYHGIHTVFGAYTA